MKYILINPVVDSMYDREQLDSLLLHNGYQRTECVKSWGPVVKEKYIAFMNDTDKTVIDVRCPVDSVSGADELKEYFLSDASKQTRLVELLYCQQGCHNGDGVLDYE